MPNHIMSSVTVAGKATELAKIRADLTETEEEDGKSFTKNLSFNKIIPMPSTVFRGNLGQEEKKIHGSNNWYDWSIANWGTKWNAYDLPDDLPEIHVPLNSLKFIVGDEAMNVMTYKFNTAWSPVFGILEALSTKYPETIIRYSYVDEGGGFAGCNYYKNGALLEVGDVTSSQEETDKLLKGLDAESLFMEFKRVIEEYL